MVAYTLAARFEGGIVEVQDSNGKLRFDAIGYGRFYCVRLEIGIYGPGQKKALRHALRSNFLT